MTQTTRSASSARKTNGLTFDDVRTMMLALPGVQEGTSFGTPAFKVRGNLIARLREDDVLVLKPVDDIEQQFLMSTAPEAFFLTEHYRGFPAILVRLSAVDGGQLQDLIEQAWSRLAGKKLLAAHAATGGR